MIRTDLPAPNGARLHLGRAAFVAFSTGVWDEKTRDPSAFFNQKPGYVQELWAQVADKIIEVMGTTVGVGRGDTPLLTKRARAGYERRNMLEGRSGEWDSEPPECRDIWRDVADAVLHQAGRNP